MGSKATGLKIMGYFLSEEKDTRIHRLIREQGIEVVFLDLKSVNGYYFWHEAGPEIGLAKRLQDNPVLLRSVLAEELGHHFTISEEDRRAGKTFYNKPKRGAYEIKENQALRWAACNLISVFDIKWFINDGGGTLCQMARRFGVTEEIARERLKALQASYPEIYQKLLDTLAEKPTVRIVG